MAPPAALPDEPLAVTPLRYAAMGCHPETARLLLDRGAEPDLDNEKVRAWPCSSLRLSEYLWKAANQNIL